jgi:hypothetical protein
MSTWIIVSLVVAVLTVACWLVGVYNRLTALQREALGCQTHLLASLSALVALPSSLVRLDALPHDEGRALAAWAQLLRLADAQTPTLMHPTQSQALEAAWGIWKEMVPIDLWWQANDSAARLCEQAHLRYTERVDAYNDQRDMWPARLAAWLFGFRRAGVARMLLDNVRRS